MYDIDSIISWIRSVPEETSSPPKGPKKRRADQQLTSPPASLDSNGHNMASTPKKRRLQTGENALDLDATPRPGPHSSASFSNTSSTTSSPKKQLMSLRLSESGVEIKPLDVNASPEAAQDFVSTMEEIGRAHDILPQALEATIIEQVKARDMDHRKWRYSFKPEVDTLPGRIPSFKEVEKIRRKASECQEFNHEEVSWNSQVHLRLLESIFEEVFGEQCGQFNAMSCTTARLHREFKPISSPTKMIDICVYASLDRDAVLCDKATEFSHMTPTQTINYTDFEPLRMRPLVLSIETKKPGVHWDTAQLQIGIWHAAQWSFLRWAVGQKLLRQRIENDTETWTEEEHNEKTLAVLSTLGFIPGVIIQGHRWHLVLSTYKDGKTRLWADHQFGTTQSCLEIYATIAGMRQLVAWARDVYLPWFEGTILG
ncbi:hypothetical protein B0T10DRAFT_524092 [Thelonectria olida]|uniref:PD-(D/E)XK nuclease-like domain-containing protein n=1 Tax=Thelonectria olida TaxID=1576542 RepID=A0A9P8VQM2_9HYPO|nr:hypothetical protein B0T10DRAFT_524092 [Thelonectria olida]